MIGTNGFNDHNGKCASFRFKHRFPVAKVTRRIHAQTVPQPSHFIITLYSDFVYLDPGRVPVQRSLPVASRAGWEKITSTKLTMDLGVQRWHSLG